MGNVNIMRHQVAEVQSYYWQVGTQTYQQHQNPLHHKQSRTIIKPMYILFITSSDQTVEKTHWSIRMTFRVYPQSIYMITIRHINLHQTAEKQTLVSILLLRLQAGLASPTAEFIRLSHESGVSCFMNSCSLVGAYERFGGKYCFHIQDIIRRQCFIRNAVNHLPG